MSIIIQSNSNGFFPINRTICNTELQYIERAQSKEEATCMSLWDKIKDWFCGTKKSEALGYLYDLLHYDGRQDTESALPKIKSFYLLNTMVGDAYKDRFHAAITENENGTYTFEFSITDVLKTRRVVYGKSEDDVNFFSNVGLTNKSEFLNQDNVFSHGVYRALKKVYLARTTELKGIQSSNQTRLGMEILSEETRKSMLTDETLIQEWVRLQMNCFDYYAGQRSSLDSTDGLSIINIIGTEHEWIYDVTQSLDKIRKNTIKYLAEDFNKH